MPLLSKPCPLKIWSELTCRIPPSHPMIPPNCPHSKHTSLFPLQKHDHFDARHPAPCLARSTAYSHAGTNLHEPPGSLREPAAQASAHTAAEGPGREPRTADSDSSKAPPSRQPAMTEKLSQIRGSQDRKRVLVEKL